MYYTHIITLTNCIAISVFCYKVYTIHTGDKILHIIRILEVYFVMKNRNRNIISEF